MDSLTTPPSNTPPSNTAPADKDLAEQALPGHGIPSQDPNLAAQIPLEPEEAKHEAQSVLMGGGVVAGAATGATIGVMVAGPVGVVVGATLGAVAGALGGAAAGATANPEDSSSADTAPADSDQSAKPHEDGSMNTITTKDASQGDFQEWKTQEYRGKQIHVCTALRVNENEELPGHGQQWDFKVRITENGAGPTAHACASAESDPGSFYSTQAITEELGFTKGRELVDGM